MTTYRILQAADIEFGWVEIGHEAASSPRQALRQAHAAAPLNGQRYLVVPERNWTELTPELVTETRLVFR